MKKFNFLGEKRGLGGGERKEEERGRERNIRHFEFSTLSSDSALDKSVEAYLEGHYYIYLGDLDSLFQP